MVIITVFEHVIDDARQLMSRGDDSLGRPMACPNATVEGAECALAAGKRLGGYSKGISRTVVCFLLPLTLPPVT